MDETADFYSHYRGRFYGVLQWTQLDKLWGQVTQQPEGWYIYFVGGSVPDHVATAETVILFIQELDQLLRVDHRYDYCGIVYADDMQHPKMIKIFDPNHLGASCGASGQAIFPRWILTRIPPKLLEEKAPIPANRQRWWQRFFPVQMAL
jgi:hypothetical protein